MFGPDVFVLGLAVGVLGLVLLLSTIVGFAYEDRTLLMLPLYLTVMVMLVFVGEHLQRLPQLTQSLLLVSGPAFIAGLQMWLLRRRNTRPADKAVSAVVGITTFGLLGLYAISNAFFAAAVRATQLTVVLSLVWFVVLAAAGVYVVFQSRDTAGPWKWWLLLGHFSGLGVAVAFLARLADADTAYWPVVLMLLLQLPPIYLCLVWRSRLLNESRLRSVAADVTDPLTGLATSAVLIERLMRITARTPASRQSLGSNALFLIEARNWRALLNQLGADFNEKLMLESALRLRRSVGDNDLVARISGGRFAVVAQDLAGQGDVAALATRLVVSGLRIDSPLLQGVELQFRVIVRPLNFVKPLALSVAHDWLAALAARFGAWPASHRSRSILVAEDESGRLEGAWQDYGT